MKTSEKLYKISEIIKKIEEDFSVKDYVIRKDCYFRIDFTESEAKK